MTSPNLMLPEVPEAIRNSSDEINDGFRALDAIVQLSVLDKDLTAPPALAVQGARYIVGAGATGAWAGRSRHVACLTADGWRFFVPRAGWLAWAIDESALYVYDGASSSWKLRPFIPAGGVAGQTLTKVDDTDYNTQWTTPAVGGGNSADVLKTWFRIQADGTNALTNVASKIGYVCTETGNGGNENLSPSTSFPRSIPVRRLFTSASVGQSAGCHVSATTTQAIYRAISGSAIGGGFTFQAAFSLGTISAGQRVFFGLYASGSAIGNVEPSSLLNMVGFACDSTDTNLQVMHNDGSGTATKVDLGFTLASLQGKYLIIGLSATAGGNVQYTLTVADDDDTFEGELSTDLPETDAGLAPHLHANTAAVTTAIQLRISRFGMIWPL